MPEKLRLFHSKNINSLERQTQPVLWVLAALIDWVLIFSAVYIVYRSFFLMQAQSFSAPSIVFFASIATLAWLLIGSRQHALSILAHDGAHGLILKNNAANDFLTHGLAFWPLGITLPTYRSFHFTHHQYLATARDPELYHKAVAAPFYDLPIASMSVLLDYTLRDLTLRSLKEIFFLFRILAKPKSITDIIPVFAWWLIVIVIMYVVNHVFLIFFLCLWFFSLATSFWAVFRLRVLTEHMGTHETHVIHASYIEQVIFLPHNTWYHAEHHFDTNISAFLLPRIRAMTQSTPMTVASLFRSYTASAKIPSGTALRVAE